MIRNLDPAAERFLNSIERIQKSLDRANREISSGFRVTAPSDAPDEIGDILKLLASLDRNEQLRTNLTRVQSETRTAEDALENASRLLDRARVLGSQGANSTQTAETRRILAGEVQGLLEELVTASQAMINGRYVFSGDRDDAPVYELDLSQPNGVQRQFVPQATRQVRHPSGTTFSAFKTAQEIFDSRNPDDSLAPENVFAAMNSLRLALENNDQAGIESALGALRLAEDHLNIQLSFYGLAERKLTNALDFAERLDLQLKTELSQRRDADLTEAALEVQRARMHQEAAYASRSATPPRSLFDYLG
jgi:flagellar hook-associated protein 3 FlgL